MQCSFPNKPAPKPENKPGSEIAAAKQDLRHQMHQLRQNLTGQQREIAALDIRKPLFDLIEQHFPRQQRLKRRPLQVAVFASCRGEIDLAPCWQDLLGLPANLYFPKISHGQEFRRIVFFQLPAAHFPEQWLCPGHFSVPEPPVNAIEAADIEFDLMLIPGLAFDRNGGRLGWGKAYYDSYLSSRNIKPLCIGIGYDFQLLDQILPMQAHDVPLDYILTPHGFIRAGA